MWSGSEEPFDGQYYKLGRTLNSPQSLARPHPYLMVGGSGEKKTLRLVAQYADACNISAGPDAARKLDVLRGHCDTVGRDYDQIEKTTIFPLDPSGTVDDIVATASAMAEAGYTAAYIFARDITEPGRIIELFAAAQARLA
ncbi:MAG TPA: LLM class F420-dependent oxidoreductase, partial [Trebonia sp.]|nr:LLM class F420-dependent oxidoreductase [Trebonia sp.]